MGHPGIPKRVFSRVGFDNDGCTAGEAKLKGQHMQAMDQTNSVNVSNLIGTKLPRLSLTSTCGEAVNLAALPLHSLLILHPFALAPYQKLPHSFSSIPFVAGCSEQLLSFKALHQEFQSEGIALFGISTQSALIQEALTQILALPFPLLSDADRDFARTLRLPMLHAGRVPRIMRMIFEIQNGCIKRVFDPIERHTNCAADILSEISLF